MKPYSRKVRDAHRNLMAAKKVREKTTGIIGSISEFTVADGDVLYMFHPKGGKGKFISGNELEVAKEESK